MATIVRMPEVLANATEAAIQGWLVAEGDTITVGQPLAEIETEKAMVEFNSEVEGVLVKLLVEVGDSVDVGAPIGVIAAAGETDVDVAALLAGEVTAAAPASAGVSSAVDSTPLPATPPATPSAADLATIGGRRFASPLVRRLAKERSLDLAGITGSGPHGRIVRRDLEGLAAPATEGAPADAPLDVLDAGAPTVVGSAAGFTDIPHTGMRRAIARRLAESKSSVPHFYLRADCRVDRLLALREEVNATAPQKISVNDFFVKAVAAALTDVPAANVTWGEEATRRYDRVDLSVAVSTDGGLLTPVLRGVESLSLSAVSAAIGDLALRARAGRLKQQELEGGSFAVSNLGMFGVDEFSAILNPPQSGILAVGAAKQRPVVVDGQLAVATVVTVTLSADHRVVDGAVAAEWLAAFVKRIESPLSMLV